MLGICKAKQESVGNEFYRIGKELIKADEGLLAY